MERRKRVANQERMERRKKDWGEIKEINNEQERVERRKRVANQERVQRKKRDWGESNDLSKMELLMV